MTKPNKRMGNKKASSREAFLDATERLLKREGYTSLIARRVAEEAGQTKQLLYYYFSSMEELVCEAYVRSITKFNKQLDKALAGPTPLAEVWKLMTKGNGRTTGEFLALANHNEEFRKAFANVSSEHYEKISEKFQGLISRNNLDIYGVTPKLFVFFLLSLSRNTILERDLGLLESGDELDRFLEMFFERVR